MIFLLIRKLRIAGLRLCGRWISIPSLDKIPNSMDLDSIKWQLYTGRLLDLWILARYPLVFI